MPGMDEYRRRVQEYRRRLQERIEEADTSLRVLPPGLQGAIIEACETERVAVVARIAELERSLVNLETMRKQALGLVRDAAAVVPERQVVRRRPDGSERTSTVRGYGMMGPRAIEARQTVQRITRHRRQIEAELSRRRSELYEIERLRAATAAGIVSGLLAVTTRWRSARFPGSLAPIVAKLGASYGEPLNVAIGPDGEPVALPTVAEARRAGEFPETYPTGEESMLMVGEG